MKTRITLKLVHVYILFILVVNIGYDLVGLEELLVVTTAQYVTNEEGLDPRQVMLVLGVLGWLSKQNN